MTFSYLRVGITSIERNNNKKITKTMLRKEIDPTNASHTKNTVKNDLRNVVYVKIP